MSAREKPCQVCDAMEGPKVFALEPYCCDNHRKSLGIGIRGEPPVKVPQP